jgi:acetyl-CoA C-acetyltransferase
VPIAVNNGLRARLLDINMGKSFGQRLGAALKGILAYPNSSRIPRRGRAAHRQVHGRSLRVDAKEWQVARADQDLLAFESHAKAAAAYESGFFKDLVVPLPRPRSATASCAGYHAEKLAR